MSVCKTLTTNLEEVVIKKASLCPVLQKSQVNALKPQKLHKCDNVLSVTCAVYYVGGRGCCITVHVVI